MLLTTTLLDIPRRLKELDPLLELDWDPDKRVYRVMRWSKRDVYLGKMDGGHFWARTDVLLPVMTVPRHACDGRILVALRAGARDWRIIERELDEASEREARSRERSLEDCVDNALGYYRTAIHRDLA